MILTYALFAFIVACVIRTKSVKRFRVWQWKSSLGIAKHFKIFHSLYAKSNGYALSRRAREKSDALEYTYGEIEFTPFIALISLTKPTANTVFYDLGCGTGKAVIACAMVFQMKSYNGIEIFKPLYLAACKHSCHLAKLEDYSRSINRIKFINDNFLNSDISEATLIFINATALFGNTWHELNKKLTTLAKDSLVITTSKKLTADNFTVTHQTNVQMSWGVVSAYIHRRI